MKKINVGKDFKLPMWGVKGECIFDKDTGYLFFEDDSLIERLKLNDGDVVSLHVEEKRSLLKKDQEKDAKFSQLELKVNDQRRDIEDLTSQIQEKEECINTLNSRIDVVGQELLKLKSIILKPANLVIPKDWNL